jgi:hypothetical protein
LTSTRSSLLAALILLVGPAARATLSCACAPCPLEMPAACDASPDPPCCGESEKPEPSCACAHWDAPEAVRTADDASIPPCTTAIEAIELSFGKEVPPAEDVIADGHDPPPESVLIFLRDLSLRL